MSVNSRSSRREFMGLVAGAGGAAGLAPWFGMAALAADGTSPDLVVVVYTVDATMPRAQGFAVTAGRFTAVGSSEFPWAARTLIDETGRVPAA